MDELTSAWQSAELNALATAPFGAGLRHAWPIDPHVTYLNHGTVGAPPRAVLTQQRLISDQIERHPARFMLREIADPGGTHSTEGVPRLRQAAARVAEFVGLADADGLAFTSNITAAANAVLRSFAFESGDQIAVTDLGYGGVTNAAVYTARVTGAEVVTIPLPRAGAEPAAFVDAIADGLTERTRMLVIDHITAQTALVLPIAKIAEACHRRGVLVLVDGAHVPGNIALDLGSLGVDWYTANLHKWAWSPRSCGFVWAAPEHRGTLHPTVISWGLDNGMAAEFDLLGTQDPTQALTAPFAIDLMRAYGVDRIQSYNHGLALWAGRHLSELWGTEFTTPEQMIGAMVAIALPPRLGSSVEDAEHLRLALDAADIEVPVYSTGDGLAIRISAQIYCDTGDIQRLAEAIATLAS